MAEETISRARMTVFRTLTAVPHREYGPLVQALRAAMDEDPDFTARACVHMASGGSNIRDQADAAIIALLQAPPTFPEYREAGRCLLLGRDVYGAIVPQGMSGLPPFRIFRILEHIGKSDRKIPRLLRSMTNDYYTMLEANSRRADGVCVGRTRRPAKNLWRSCNLRGQESKSGLPCDFPYLHALLFEKEPPEGSKAAAVKAIQESTDPKEWLRLATENKLPYLVLASILPDTTAAKVVLVSSMTPTQALNAGGWVERNGLLEIPEVRDAYTAKVAQATASAASIQHRKSVKVQDEGVRAAQAVAAEKAVEKQQRIQKRTALLVDISASMEPAIAAAIQLGPRIAAICDAGLSVAVFNDFARVLTVGDHNLAGWQTAFRGVRCSGWTSMEAGLNAVLKSGFEPEQIVVVTDGGENRGGFARAVTRMDPVPNVALLMVPGRITAVRVGTDPRFEQSLNGAQVTVDSFAFDGSDYYVLDQIAAVLGGPPAVSVIERIMETELPRRASWQARR